MEIKSCANLAVARASMAEWGPAARIRAASGLWVSAGQFQWTSPGGDRKSAEYVRYKPTKDKEKMKGEKRSREEAAVSQRTKLRKCRQPARYTQRSQHAAAQASTAAAGAHGRPRAPYARVDLRSAQPDAGAGHGIDLGLTKAVAISLPQSKDRRLNIRATMDQLGAPMVVTAAVDGAAVVQRSVRMKRGIFRVHLTAEGRSKLGISTARVATTVAENVPGVFGCTRSHMRALEKVKYIQPDGTGYALVVEDDAVLGLEKEPWKNVALPVEGARFEAAAVRRIVKNLTAKLGPPWRMPGIIWLGASDGWPARTSGAPVVLSTYRYKGRTYELKHGQRVLLEPRIFGFAHSDPGFIAAPCGGDGGRRRHRSGHGPGRNHRGALLCQQGALQLLDASQHQDLGDRLLHSRQGGATSRGCLERSLASCGRCHLGRRGRRRLGGRRRRRDPRAQPPGPPRMGRL